MTKIERGDGAKKPPLGILPLRALVGAARVLANGDAKHAPGDWIKIPLLQALKVYTDAELRHRSATQELSGLFTAESFSNLDAESGLPHIDHQIMNLIILRALMIRDGILPEDPGSDITQEIESCPKEPAPRCEHTHVFVITPNDPPARCVLGVEAHGTGYNNPHRDITGRWWIENATWRAEGNNITTIFRGAK